MLCAICLGGDLVCQRVEVRSGGGVVARYFVCRACLVKHHGIPLLPLPAALGEGQEWHLSTRLVDERTEAERRADLDVYMAGVRRAIAGAAAAAGA